MSDTRHKNSTWNIGEKPTWDGAKVAVLMDIRDELVRIRTVLECPNVNRIPVQLHRIATNTAKPRKKVRR